jgi:P4 family phage/plasmid primase-like protien
MSILYHFPSPFRVGDFQGMTTDLFEESTRLTEDGRLTIPFCYAKTQYGQIKKFPAKGSGEWSNQRGTVYNVEYRRKWFAETADVVAIAIAMNSIKVSIALDIDGYEARKIFHKWILSKFAPSLQHKIRRTTHTLSPGGGDHFVLGIKREYFPLLHLKFGDATEVKTAKIWKSDKGEHSEITLIGTKSCLIERGLGYQNLRELECEEMLERKELVNMLASCEAFQTEYEVMSECVKILSPYWKQPDRDEIVFAISGWWHKDSNIQQRFTEQFFNFLIISSQYQDENLVKTLSVIRRSYTMNKKDAIGRSKLDEIFVDKTIRLRLKRELEKLGYTFKDEEERDYKSNAQMDKETSAYADANGSGKTFVDNLIEEHHILTLEDTKEFYRYDIERGIYVGNAEPFIKGTIAHRFKNLKQRVTVKQMNQLINEIQWFSYFNRNNFNKDIKWIACANCMINLKTRETARFSPDFYCTTRLPVKYVNYNNDDFINDFFRLVESGGIYPAINKFLNELFFPEDIEKLLNYMAYCLWRDYEFNFWLLLNGGGLDGKSLLFNLIAMVFGTDNVAGESLHRLSDENNKFATAGLYNKLANFDVDISKETVFKNTGTIKRLTGNDYIIGEQKFRTQYKFKNNAKLFFSVNKIPETYDESDAFYRRIIIINLRQQFLGDKVDLHLSKKLTTESELSGLLYELVRRVPIVLEQGLQKVTAESIRETQVKFIIDSNLIDYFHEKVIQHQPNDRTRLVTKLEMHEEYCKFAAFHKLTPESEAATSRKLSSQKYGMNYAKHTIHGERVYAWEGVSLRDDWMQIDDPTPEGAMEFKLKDFDDFTKKEMV